MHTVGRRFALLSTSPLHLTGLDKHSYAATASAQDKHLLKLASLQEPSNFYFIWSL